MCGLPIAGLQMQAEEEAQGGQRHYTPGCCSVHGSSVPAPPPAVPPLRCDSATLPANKTTPQKHMVRNVQGTQLCRALCSGMPAMPQKQRS